MTSHDTFAADQRVVIPSDTSAGLEVQEQIIEHMERMNFGPRDLFCTRLALTEAITNAIRHGNRMSADKQVEIAWSVSEEKIRIVIQDEGPGFDPSELLDPTDDDNLERPGGRGVMLMRGFMDLLEYNERGNQITLEKLRSAE